MKQIKFPSWFLFIFFAGILIGNLAGCQSLAPDYNGGITAQRDLKSESNRTGFLESAKLLLMPDLDDAPDTSKHKSDSKTENHKLADNNRKTQKSETKLPPKLPPDFSYGNSIATSITNPPTNYTYPYPLQQNSPHGYFAAQYTNSNLNPNSQIWQQNNNVAQMYDTAAAAKSTSSPDNINNSTQQKQTPTQKNPPEIEHNPNDLTASNVPDTNSKNDTKKSTATAKSTAKPATDLVANQKPPVKRYKVDPLLPQRGDSENFRLFLKEAASVPASKLKVSETELAERIEAFRVETAEVNDRKFETIAIGNLRADVLPDAPAKKNRITAKRDLKKDELDDNDSDNDNFADKKIEQAAYNKSNDFDADNNLRNKNDRYAASAADNSNHNNHSTHQSAQNATSHLSKKPLPINVSRIGTEHDLPAEHSSHNRTATPNTQQSMPRIPQLTSNNATTQHSGNSKVKEHSRTESDVAFADYNSGKVDAMIGNSNNNFVTNDRFGSVINANYMKPNTPENYQPNQYDYVDRGNEGNWEQQVRYAMSILQREMERMPQLRTFANEMRFRLLALSIGNRGESMKPFSIEDKAVSEFWSHEVLGLTALMEEAVIPDRRTRYDAALMRFDSGVMALKQICPLRLKNVQLVQNDVLTFGNFQTRNDECKAGEEVIVYLELENPTIRSSSQGYVVRASVVCDILDASSNIVQKDVVNGKVQDISFGQKRDHFIKMVVALKKNFPVGHYNLRIRVTDQNYHDDQKFAEEQIPIRILP
ncbi:MAG: hypothetical protein LBQ66_05325 [Planctomycetaceae bacterium]|jgi:hypothetical protein|nr:hypothetical protein [Planctomycetaceae bacterium]